MSTPVVTEQLTQTRRLAHRLTEQIAILIEMIKHEMRTAQAEGDADKLRMAEQALTIPQKAFEKACEAFKLLEN